MKYTLYSVSIYENSKNNIGVWTNLRFVSLYVNLAFIVSCKLSSENREIKPGDIHVKKLWPGQTV